MCGLCLFFPCWRQCQPVEMVSSLGRVGGAGSGWGRQLKRRWGNWVYPTVFSSILLLSNRRVISGQTFWSFTSLTVFHQHTVITSCYQIIKKIYVLVSPLIESLQVYRKSPVADWQPRKVRVSLKQANILNLPWRNKRQYQETSFCLHTNALALHWTLSCKWQNVWARTTCLYKRKYCWKSTEPKFFFFFFNSLCLEKKLSSFNIFSFNFYIHNTTI